MPNAGSSTSAEQFNQGTGQQDENTALHVGVNYLYNAEGDISAFAMDLKNFEDRRRVLPCIYQHRRLSVVVP